MRGRHLACPYEKATGRRTGPELAIPLPDVADHVHVPGHGGIVVAGYPSLLRRCRLDPLSPVMSSKRHGLRLRRASTTVVVNRLQEVDLVGALRSSSQHAPWSAPRWPGTPTCPYRACPERSSTSCCGSPKNLPASPPTPPWRARPYTPSSFSATHRPPGDPATRSTTRCPLRSFAGLARFSTTAVSGCCHVLRRVDRFGEWEGAP
jgi:hypothetical protein